MRVKQTSIHQLPIHVAVGQDVSQALCELLIPTAAHVHTYVQVLLPLPVINDHTTTVVRPFFRDHRSEPVPEENFWTFWCKGRLTEADTQTIRLGATPSGLSSSHLHHPPFLQAGCPSCRPINSVKALKATIRIREKTLGFSSMVLPAPSPYRTPYFQSLSASML